MHAIRQYKPGKLVYERVPEPSPGRGQVRIAVNACVVDRGDAPIPGHAVAGVVDKLGEGVPRRWRGKRVAVHLGPDGGGYADHVVASVEALHKLPGALDDASAAAMVGIGRRAMGIVEVAGLVPGDVVLVLASGDGIGPLLAQSAHNVRATVALTDGASIVGGPVTVVLDGVGGKAGRAAFDLLAPGGRMVHWAADPALFTPEQLRERDLSARSAADSALANLSGGLRHLEDAALTEAAFGRVVPTVRTFPLKDAVHGIPEIGITVLVP
ncbi:hypothetical protein ACFORH_11030 [Amycolatopsis roodepoortensis]|uniref:NADPH2:quinone reductase n=1 Tax=Amycolatopsis roodepoortensis TaxID=700274 RepID=A0ABR9LAN2_9PSEU|nr:oxidoreductase [Amycolatopsis roodepoortensis]MBE1577716.1 NADPH2:quinone reductase [Amycolatopsis roodepoortensis]